MKKTIMTIILVFTCIMLTSCGDSEYGWKEALNDIGEGISEGVDDIGDSVNQLIDDLSKIGDKSDEPTPEIQIPEETYEVDIGIEALTEENSIDITGYKEGDIIFFGEYEQDDDKNNGKEPIEWIVLEKNSDWVFVLSKYAIEYTRFFSSGDSNEHWDKSYVRGWLNNTFYTEAFSESEKKQILETTVSTFDDPESDYYYNDSVIKTQDKVFLLSISDIKNPKYGFKEGKEGNSDRRCKATDYALAKSYNEEDKGYVEYWIRSQGNTKKLFDRAHHGKSHYRAGAVVVEKDGFISSYSDSFDERFVRPALFIRIRQNTNAS